MKDQKSLKIRKGQSIPLIFDRAAKIAFGEKNSDLTNILASSILDIPYDELVGNIEFFPLNYNLTDTNESALESDLILLVKTPVGDRRLIIEFNYYHSDLLNKTKKKNKKLILSKTKQEKHDRTLGYLCKLYSSIKVGEKFSEVSPITLINFDSFGTYDNELADYMMLNYKDIRDFYSKKISIRNINVAKCYYEWYNHKYQRRNINEHNLFILSVMMATDKLDEVYRLIEELEIDSSLKKRFRKVVNEMNLNPELIGMYYNYDEELKKSNDAILKSVREEFAKENFEKGEAKSKKEMVINMYKDNALIEKICKYANLPIKKVNKIIEDYKRKYE